MIDRKLLKANARARMAESQPRYWQVMLVWFLAAVLAPAIIQGVVPDPMTNYATLVSGGIDPYMAMAVLGGGTAMVGLFLAIVLALFQMVMSFGTVNYALKLYRGEECGHGSIFEGFTLVGRVIGAQLLVALFIVLWGILLAIPMAVVVGLCIAFIENVVGAILTVVVIIAYYVAIVIITLKYSLTNQALADDPEVGALGAIQRSKDLMRGHKGEFFVIMLSFLGWMILCGLLSGIIAILTTAGARVGLSLLSTLPTIVLTVLTALAGLPIYLWLEPYVQLTYAGFYDALCPRQGDEPTFEPLNDYPQF